MFEGGFRYPSVTPPRWWRGTTYDFHDPTRPPLALGSGFRKQIRMVYAKCDSRSGCLEDFALGGKKMQRASLDSEKK